MTDFTCQCLAQDPREFALGLPEETLQADWLGDNIRTIDTWLKAFLESAHERLKSQAGP